MKPCDCRSIKDTQELEESGIGFNNYRLEVVPGSVLVEITPYVRITIPMRYFQRFAEWYLKDQNKGESKK